MYSQCPDCLARFRVTAAQLRAAHGTVRCGRCGGAFDALVRLSDSLPAVDSVDHTALLADESDGIAAAAASGVPPEYHFSAADLEKVFIEARDWAPEAADRDLRVRDPEPEPQAVVVDEPERVEDITLEGEKIRIEDVETDEFSEAMPADDGTATPLDFDLTRDIGDTGIVDLELDEDDTTNRLHTLRDVPGSAYPDEKHESSKARAASPTAAASLAPAREAAASVSPLCDAAAAAASSAPATARPAASAARDWPLPASQRGTPAPAATSGAIAAQRWVSATRETPMDLDPFGDDDAVAPPRRRTLTWAIGSLVLALLLVVQLTNHYREHLLRQPQIGPALRSVYASLGLPISSAWNLDAFEIRQWGATGDAPANGQLQVRASLTNRAAFAQPLPLLRLEVEDRFGEAVAIRDFEPREYLKDPQRSSRMLASGEAAEAELDLVAPSTDAVGYRLNVCMRDTDESVHCATSSG